MPGSDASPLPDVRHDDIAINTISAAAPSRNLKPLERDGYLVQHRDAQDGRSRRVTLTADGRAKLLESNLLWRAAQETFDAVYGRDRAHALRNALVEIFQDGFTEAFHRTLTAKQARLRPKPGNVSN